MGDAGGAPTPTLAEGSLVRRVSRVAAIVGLAAVAAGTFALGFLTLFSTLAPYDDEGYFLVSLKGYVGGATLYNDIYGQYGPFYFELMGGVFKALGLPVNNDNGRMITLVLWFAAAVLLGAAAFRLTRSVVLAAVTGILAFRVVSLAPNEPMHPGHLLVFLLAAAAAVAALLVERRPRMAFALIGALAAMALLSKVNVGVFALASTAFACVLASPRLQRVRPLVYLITAAFVGTPVLLMAKNLEHRGYFIYGVHIMLCALALAVVVVTAKRAEGDRGAAWWPVWAAGGAAALTAAAVSVAVAQGTTISALLHGVILDALNQTNVYSAPLQLSATVLLWDVLSVTAAVVVTRSALPAGAQWRVIAGLLRLGVGVWIWLDVVGRNPLGVPVALVWVAAVPSRRDLPTPAARFVRVFLPALALLQTLHAYPVPGSQVQWAALLLVPLGAICIGDGIAELKALPLPRPWLGRLLPAALLGLALWALPTALVNPLRHARHTYRGGVSLGEPGVRWIRVDPTTAATYQWLTGAIKSHCATFVSSPGFGSLYGMTGEKAPTWINLSGWLFAFNAKTQDRAVRQVEHTPGLCAVRNPAVEAFWSQGRPIPQLALYKFITEDFRTVASRGGFDVMVRKTP